MPDTAPPSQLLTEFAQRLSAQEAAQQELARKLEQAERERDEYRRVYLALLEAYRKLEAGLFGQKRERFEGAGAQEQLTLSLLAMLTSGSAPAQAESTPLQVQKVQPHERRKPTGRKPLPEHLPRIHVEVLPVEVQRAGLEAFERIGEEISEVLERRPSSLVVVRTVRPKFVPKAKREELAAATSRPETPEEIAAASPLVLPVAAATSSPVAEEEIAAASSPVLPVAAATNSPVAEEEIALASAPVLPVAAAQLSLRAPVERSAASSPVLQAPALDLPLPRSLCGPGLLADTLVRRWQDHLPLYRLERVYGREGLELPRSTVCDWHREAAQLVKPLIDAMWKDALRHSAYLCIDATGVLVQAREKCRRAHFFVVVAPGRHVLFGYQKTHDSAAVDTLLEGYKGFLVADAHSVYEHLYLTGEVLEVGFRVGGDVAAPAPHSPGRADFPHPVLHGAVSLGAA